MDSRLVDMMSRTYSCNHFGTCREAVFDPSAGLVPRGFLGATGSLSDVQAIFVLAEPGHPLKNETYPLGRNEETFQKVMGHTYECFKKGENLLHRNVRKVMSFIWPDLTFDQQLKHVWITEGRLCSIEKEIGAFHDKLCAPTHLVNQVNLMPDAIVVAFSNKAKDRVMLCPEIVDRQPVYCRALAPPGCNRKDAPESWENAAAVVRAKFNLPRPQK